MMKQLTIRAIAAAAMLAAASTASAAVIASFGAAPGFSDARATFQANTLLANNYVENGLVFKYTGIGNNAGCGYAGVDCYDFPEDLSPAFSGNYMATSGNNAYISVRRADGQDFIGIQFAAGTGYLNLNGYWQAYNDNVLTGSGTFSRAHGAVLSLRDVRGFDEIRYFAFSRSGSTAGFSSAAIDEVGVDLPEPGSIALVGAGLLGLAGLRRRRSDQA